MEFKKFLLKHPSAVLPLLMSFTALALVLVSVSMFGVVHETDEGTGAHIWQILMGGELPIIAFFAIKYLPRYPKQTLLTLVFQFVAGLAACFPVFYFKL